MANMSLKKNPMPSQEPAVRAHNFDEVTIGYSAETAVDEALRCLSCKNMPCVSGCPVNIHIPEFIAKVKEPLFRVVSAAPHADCVKIAFNSDIKQFFTSFAA